MRRILKNNDLKAISVAFLILFSMEIVLWVLESNSMMEEPYFWGERNLVPYKINRCNELFSESENKGKIKVVIMGDSTAEFAFDPKTFDDFTNKKTISFNLGIRGSSVRFQSFLINKLVIEKIKPDIIIWSLNVPNDFKDDEKVNQQEEDNLNSQMAKYYRDDVNHFDIFENPDLFFMSVSRIYKYRLFFIPNFLDINPKLKEEIENYDKQYKRGFEPSYEIYNGIDLNYSDDFREEKFNIESGDLFFETIHTIQENKIDLLIVSNPFQYGRQIYPSTEDLFSQISSKIFLDLNGNQSFIDNELFHDDVHLNFYGAQIYTELIYNKIKDLYEF